MKLLTVLRIRRMEKYFDTVSAAVKSADISSKSVKRKIRILEKYQQSGKWLRDFEFDEKGVLPKKLKRGVLSEDGLYNLLNEIKMQ